MIPYLEIWTPSGQLFMPSPTPQQWPAGILGEHGWTPGPPLCFRTYGVPPETDRFAINVEVYDGRERRTSVFNAFQDPAPTEGILNWAELIWTWTRWRPATQNEGMFRRDIYLPPIAKGKVGWARVTLVGPPDGGMIPELLSEHLFTVVRP